VDPQDEISTSGTVPSGDLVPTPRNAAAAPAVLERGSTVGRYVVLALEGQGAMGEVYGAFDPELNRKIALKLLKNESAGGGLDSETRRRLLREAQAIARLSHANIVVVHDAGAIDGRVFIAMEFVEGQPLVKWLRAGRHPWREVLDLFLAAGRGLAHAHAHGIVHRDFKPHNILLGKDGTVRVMDFGLARDLGAETGDAGAAAPPGMGLEGSSTQALAGAAASNTRTTIVGTPAYMAPEQFRGDPADARSDQFSFCVALYEGLYGERPFDGSGGDVGFIARAVAEGRVREAPARSGVPARLRRALLRGLRPAREDRFPSMAELLVELSRDPERRRKRLAVGAAVAVALVAAGAGAQRVLERPVALCRDAGARLAGAWELPGAGARPRHDAIEAAFTASGLASAGETWRRVSAGLDDYAREWSRMSTESCELARLQGDPSAAALRGACLTGALQRLRALTDVLTGADRAVVQESVNAVNALPDLARCADLKALQAVAPLPQDPATRAQLDALGRRLAEVTALRDTGKLDAALPKAHALVADARVVGYDPTLARALDVECWLTDKAGWVAKAIPMCEEAVWSAEASREEEVAAATATQLVALTATSKARREDSERWAHLAAALLKRMGPGHGKLEGWLAHNQGLVELLMGEPAKARGHFERAISIKGAAEGPDSLDVALSLNDYGNVLHDLGDHEGGLAALRRASKIIERTCGPRNRMVAMPLSNQGEILNSLGRPREALDAFQRSIAIIEAEAGPRAAWLPYPLTGMGASLLALGRPAEAIAPLERARGIRDGSEQYPIPRGETRFALARALWESGGDRARARALAVSAREEYGRATGAGKQVAEIDAWLRARGG
jgi:tetratricopeptide (TPR) repeat protein